MSGSFDNLTDIFESIIDWPKRLANEAPFFRSIFESVGIKSLFDAACGTGHHAAMFHEWGLEVEGADISPNMIARARTSFGDQPGLQWVVRPYDQPSPTTFDAAICIGNSLALAKDIATAHDALRHMMTSARRCLILHVLNLWSLPEGPAVWQKCVQTTLPAGPVQIIKGVHLNGTRGFIELLVTTLEPHPKLRSESVTLLALEASDINEVLHAAGAKNVTFYGGYQKQPYDRATSVDLIAVAGK